MSELLIIIPENFAINEALDLKGKTEILINDGNSNLKFDFSKCEFIDSTGIGVLVSIYKKLNEVNGHMRLCTVNEQVMRVLNLTRLDSVFDIIK